MPLDRHENRILKHGSSEDSEMNFVLSDLIVRYREKVSLNDSCCLSWSVLQRFSMFLCIAEKNDGKILLTLDSNRIFALNRWISTVHHRKQSDETIDRH